MSEAPQLPAIFNQANLMTRIAQRLRGGWTVDQVAERLKVSRGTLMDWIEKDEERVKLLDAAIIERRKRFSETMLRKLIDSADHDVSRIFNANGTVKSIHEWPEEIRKIVGTVKFDENGALTEVKLPDRLKALELAGKLLGVFVEKRETESTIKYVVEVPPVAQSIEAWAKDVTPQLPPKVDGND